MVALTGLGQLVATLLGTWFSAIVAIIAIEAFRGRIVTAGLLSSATGRGPGVGRMQLLLATLAVAIGYAGAALTRAPGQGLPDVPTYVLAALLGSHGIYLGGKRLPADRRKQA